MKTEPNEIPKDFRLYLQQELIRRCQKNESHSLRSFSRSLGISSSALSATLNRKRPLTQKTAIRLATSLGLSSSAITSLQIAKKKQRKSKESSDVKQIALDTFACLSDWYVFPILEVIRTRNFKPNHAWIATTLGLTRSEVNSAVERLLRVGLLEIEKDGTWVDRSDSGRLTTINGELTSASAKILQQRILELARRAVTELPIEVRSNTSLTFSLHLKDLPAAKKKIQKFGRELAGFFERAAEPEHVYQFTCALFPLTKFKP